MATSDAAQQDRLKRLAQAFDDYQKELATIKQRQEQILHEAMNLYQSDKLEETRSRLSKLLQ